MSDDLRDRLAAALYQFRELTCLWEESDGTTEAIANVAAKAVQPELDRLAHYESAINWQVSCLACARVLDSSITETERAEKAEAEVIRQVQFKAELLGQLGNAVIDAKQVERERDALLATLARVRKYAELMTDSAVVPVRGYGTDVLHLIDCPQEHATIAEQDACAAPPAEPSDDRAQYFPCACCDMGQHDQSCTCSGTDCCRPERHAGPAGAGSTKDGA